MTIPMTVNDKR